MRDRGNDRDANRAIEIAENDDAVGRRRAPPSRAEATWARTAKRA